MHLNPSGADWLTIATDPFHDYEVPVAGYPDSYHEATAVNYGKRLVTIKKPENLPPGATWSASFFTLPQMRSSKSRLVFDSTLNDLKLGDKIYDSGTLNVWTAMDGVSMFPVFETETAFNALDPGFTREHLAYSALDTDEDYMGRLIAGGFEVHNDTPDLFKGGSVTVYSAPQAHSSAHMAKMLNTPKTGDEALGLLKNKRGIPPTPQTASAYRSARTWEASEGVMVPFQLQTEGDSLEFKALDTDIAFYRSGDATKAGGMVNEASVLDPNANIVSAQVPMREVPLDTVGAFFSGLNENTVLTLSIKMFVEIAPTVADQAILKLSSHSADLDVRARHCYQHCLSLLPPGVPVGMNEKGDWWKMVLKTLKTMAPVALAATTVVAPEFAPLVGGVNALVQSAPVKRGKKVVTQPMRTQKQNCDENGWHVENVLSRAVSQNGLRRS
jgi:hypothetical protein